jgi:hypothetical protein
MEDGNADVHDIDDRERPKPPANRLHIASSLSTRVPLIAAHSTRDLHPNAAGRACSHSRPAKT